MAVVPVFLLLWILAFVVLRMLRQLLLPGFCPHCHTVLRGFLNLNCVKRQKPNFDFMITHDSIVPCVMRHACYFI